MVRRLFALLVLVWLFGFLWFTIDLPLPIAGGRTDAAVVFTGGEGRIGRGIETLRQGWTRTLLVSGVDREVRAREFAAEYEVSPQLMQCCVVLGYDSYDTRSNALEVTRWLAENDFESVRLITTDWHMRRAALELEMARDDHVRVLRDAVPSEPSLRILFLEYHKLLARHLSRLWGG